MENTISRVTCMHGCSFMVQSDDEREALRAMDAHLREKHSRRRGSAARRASRT